MAVNCQRDVAGGGAAHGCGPRFVDHEAAFLGTLGAGGSARRRGRLGEPAAGDHVEVDSSRADHEGAACRHRERGGGLHRLARPQPLQDHRRPAGIGRRAHPGVDAEIGRHHHALPIEGRSDALDAFTAGGDEGRDDQHRHESPHRERVAPRQPGRRAPGPERLGRTQRPLHMGAPQRDRKTNPSVGAAISSAIAVAGRCGRPELRSSRCRPSILLGTRSMRNGAKAAAVSRKKTPRPIARPIGGSHSQSPSQDSARNRPTTVATDASAGHSRSQKIVQRARPSARASRASSPARAQAQGGVARGCVGASGDRSVKYVSSKENPADCRY